MAKKVALNKRDRDKIAKLLRQRQTELKKDLDGTENEIDALQDPKADDLDRAVEAGAMELLVTLGDTERRELEEIVLALEKIQRGGYGKCESCGTFIPKLRLEALPTARLCVACQEVEERSQVSSSTRRRPRRVIFGEDMDTFSHPLMDSNDDN